MAANNQVREVTVRMNGRQIVSNLKSLQAEARKVRAEFRKASDPRDQQRLAREYRNVNKEIKRQNELIYSSRKAFSSLTSFIKGFGTMALSYLGISAITSQMSQLIKKSAELSDTLSGVSKTTGLTNSQVRNLNQELSVMNTRTARTELLEMGKVAGKLGITTQKDVLGFISAMDKLVIAMGEDLGDANEVARSLGKINEAFGVSKMYSVEDAMLKVGSAINHLGKSSTASEADIVNFTQRLAGVAPLANISVQDVMGLGAALDALGQRTEMSTTAISKLLIKMSENREAFARMADMELNEFIKLMDEDANEALLRVLENVGKNTNGISSLTDVLGDLGTDGARVTAVLGTMANNIDFVRKQQKISNDEFRKGTSVLNEFNLMNENFAAKYAKGLKFISDSILDSGFVKGIQNMIANLSSFIPQAESATDKLRNLRSEMNLELEALKNANLTQNQRAKIIEELNNKYKEYLPRLIEEKDTLEDIDSLQKQANANILNRVLLMDYEKEITTIQQEYLEAQKNIYNIELERQKLQKEALNLDNAAMVESQMQQLDNMEAYQQKIIDEAPARMDEARKKFESIAEKMGEDLDKLLLKIESGGGRKSIPGQQVNIDNKVSGDMSQFSSIEDYIAGKAELAQELWLMQQEENERELIAITEKYEKMLEMAEYYGLENNAINKLLQEEYLSTLNAQLSEEKLAEEKAAKHKADLRRKELEDELALNAEKWRARAALMNATGSMLVESLNFMASVSGDNLMFQQAAAMTEIITAQAVGIANAVASGMKSGISPIEKAAVIAAGISLTISNINRAVSVLKSAGSPSFSAPPPPVWQVDPSNGRVSNGNDNYGRGGRLFGPSHSDPSGGMPIIDPYSGQIRAMVEGGETILSKEVSRVNAPLVNMLLQKSLNADKTPINLNAFSRSRNSTYSSPTSHSYSEPSSSQESNQRPSYSDAIVNEIRKLRQDLNTGKIKGNWDWHDFNEGIEDMEEIERKAGLT